MAVHRKSRTDPMVCPRQFRQFSKTYKFPRQNTNFRKTGLSRSRRSFLHFLAGCCCPGNHIVIVIGHPGPTWAHWVPRGTQGLPGPKWAHGSQEPRDPIGDPGTQGSPPKPVVAHPEDPWDPWGHPGTLGGPRGPSGDPGDPWGNPGTLGPKTHVIWVLGPMGPRDPGTQ